jgi:Protein of unknown function (DUF551)
MSITKILQGIDRCEVEYTDGWWETSTGAEFGLLKLAEARGYEFGLLGRITELEAQLADAKQAARYETDVAAQAIADFEEVKAQLAAVQKDAAWIPVSERLPEPDSECFVWAQSVNGKHSFAYPTEWAMQREAPDMMYPSATVEIGYCWDDFDFDKVSHWVYQPKPPIAGAATEQPLKSGGLANE